MVSIEQCKIVQRGKDQRSSIEERASASANRSTEPTLSSRFAGSVSSYAATSSAMLTLL